MGRRRHAIHVVMPSGLAFPGPEVVADLSYAVRAARSVPAHG